MTKRSASLTLLGVTLFSALCVWLASGLKFSYDFEAFFPQNDPETDFYIDFRESFETDNDFFIVVLESNGSVFDSTFLSKVDSLNSRLSGVDNVVAAIGPTRLTRYVRDPVLGQVMALPVLRWNEPENFAIDSTDIARSTGMLGYFFAEDFHSVAINIRHTEKLSKQGCDQLSLDIEAVVSEYVARRDLMVEDTSYRTRFRTAAVCGTYDS